jgi:2-polyprenyl-3-methyl-5-hydroxy-6-metoxy-1,4-benzoquinol methylase
MEWPAADLESVKNCPVCGSEKRSSLHDGLKDWTFHAAPGAWSMWRCTQCACAFLDPRPTTASIASAYRNYYTHQQACGQASYAALGTLRKLRRRCVNGYATWRFGLKSDEPRSALGIVAALAVPFFKRQIDHKYRNLPGRGAPGRSLLDVGCGDGSFLALAEACGWKPLGIDADMEAVARARLCGISVLPGSIEVLDGREEEFDVITLNHVIEHMHDPVSVIETCHRLLKPGGQLWIETPNVDSYSHARFGKFWRGLEAPRHLVLFCENSLHRLLGRVGFVAVERVRRPSAFHSLYNSSLAIQIGVEGTPPVRPVFPRLEATLSTLRALARPQYREHLTTIARKRDLRTQKGDA